MTTTLQKWDAKDPQDIADYFFDWAKLPLPVGATITSTTVVIPADADQPAPTAPDDLLSLEADDLTGTIQRMRFAGGVPNVSYPVDLTIWLTDGQRFNITKTLAIKERTK